MKPQTYVNYLIGLGFVVCFGCGVALTQIDDPSLIKTVSRIGNNAFSFSVGAAIASWIKP